MAERRPDVGGARFTVIVNGTARYDGPDGAAAWRIWTAWRALVTEERSFWFGGRVEIRRGQDLLEYWDARGMPKPLD